MNPHILRMLEDSFSLDAAIYLCITKAFFRLCSFADLAYRILYQVNYFGCLVFIYLFIYLLCALNPLDEVVLEGTGNKAICSGLPHSVAFYGPLRKHAYSNI